MVNKGIVQIFECFLAFLCEQLLNFLHTGRKCIFPHFVLCGLTHLIWNKTGLGDNTCIQYYSVCFIQKLQNFSVSSLFPSPTSPHIAQDVEILDMETFKHVFC